MQAFAHALHSDEPFFDQASSPPIPGTPVHSGPRIRKVSALSDFAPVNLKVKRYGCLPNWRMKVPNSFSSLGEGSERKMKNGTTGSSLYYVGPF